MEDLTLQIQETLRKQKEFFDSGATLDIKFRKQQLKKLYDAVVAHEKEISDALYKDLHKSEFEAYATEIGFVLEEISTMLGKVGKWSKPRRKASPLVVFKSSSFVYPEPFGQVLIISPWNYPFQLLFAPLAGAIAAGNTVVLKPSPYSEHTSAVMTKIINETFDAKYIAIFEGHRDVNQALLEQKFDFIFFTGSPNTGKVVMQYAAKNLTPVVLELGGKSPTIVDKDANIKLAAKSIAWGKFINAGQTCIAPDYLFVHKDKKDELLKLIVHYIEKFYGKDQRKSEHYPRIINMQNVDRLYEYLKCGTIYYGGAVDRNDRFIQPTILTDVDVDCDVMKYEIFGPILPVLEFTDIDEVLRFVRSRPKPLAFYYFGNNKTTQEYVLKHSTSGGATLNDTLMHFVNPNIPFGGVGNSGMGRYHGRQSFETFSNLRSVLKRATWIDLPVKYLPPRSWKLKLLKKLLK